MKSNILTIMLVLLTSLNSFGISDYKAFPLKNLADYKTSNTNDSFISFNHYFFNKSDCKKYLGRDKIISRGYQPIQIKFTNNSERFLKLTLDDFSCPCIDYEYVVDHVEFNTMARVLGWGIAGVFFFPFIIPAVIEAVKSPKANYKLFIDFSKKALITQVVKPFSSVNGLIFVEANNANKDFSFVLKDEETNEKFVLSTTNKYLDID